MTDDGASTRRDGGRTRRGVLAGLAAAAATAAAGRARAAEPAGLAAILDASGLGAQTGFALADAATGETIEAHQPDVDRPPASTAKIVTALYALDRLGPAHRFETRLSATGPFGSGALAGDLVLVGGGDPLLDTDALGDLAAAAREAGLARVEGRFVVDAAALPQLDEIEAGQPADAPYNPAISGLNLNFNRVFLAWTPGDGGPDLRLSAPGARFDADAGTVAVEMGDAGPPRRRSDGERETWTFAPASLEGSGGVWLPVRAPARYAGDVFRTLAGRADLTLPPAQAGAAPAAGATLARHESMPLGSMLRDMLRFSTNLTAEVVGLRASGAGVGGAAGSSLAASGAAMTDWARARYGLRRARLVNHSGLTVRSAMTPMEMTRLLVAAASRDGLAGMLRERPVADGVGGTVVTPGVRVVAKTGTLDFVSALAGYVEGPGTARRAFAIFAADRAARARVAPEARADPPGADAFARRARAQEQALLRRWIGIAG